MRFTTRELPISLPAQEKQPLWLIHKLVFGLAFFSAPSIHSHPPHPAGICFCSRVIHRWSALRVLPRPSFHSHTSPPPPHTYVKDPLALSPRASARPSLLQYPARKASYLIDNHVCCSACISGGCPRRRSQRSSCSVCSHARYACCHHAPLPLCCSYLAFWHWRALLFCKRSLQAQCGKNQTKQEWITILNP